MKGKRKLFYSVEEESEKKIIVVSDVSLINHTKVIFRITS